MITPGTSGIDVWRPVLDGPTLYWASDNPHGAVLRTAKSQTPQTPQILATEQVNVSPPVLGPADLYWIASASDWSFEVRTLPK